MANLIISRGALRQLAEIRVQRREQAGLASAERLGIAFERFFAMVREFPRVGTVTDRVGNDEYRRFPVEGFIVRFRVRPSGDVTVVDIRHGQMRGPALDVLEQEAERTYSPGR